MGGARNKALDNMIRHTCNANEVLDDTTRIKVSPAFEAMVALKKCIKEVFRLTVW